MRCCDGTQKQKQAEEHCEHCQAVHAAPNTHAHAHAISCTFYQTCTHVQTHPAGDDVGEGGEDSDDDPTAAAAGGGLSLRHTSSTILGPDGVVDIEVGGRW